MCWFSNQAVWITQQLVRSVRGRIVNKESKGFESLHEPNICTWMISGRHCIDSDH